MELSLPVAAGREEEEQLGTCLGGVRGCTSLHNLYSRSVVCEFDVSCLWEVKEGRRGNRRIKLL